MLNIYPRNKKKVRKGVYAENINYYPGLQL